MYPKNDDIKLDTRSAKKPEADSSKKAADSAKKPKVETATAKSSIDAEGKTRQKCEGTQSILTAVANLGFEIRNLRFEI